MSESIDKINTINTILKMQVRVPETPNYLSQELPDWAKKAGITPKVIHLHEFGDEFLRRLGAAWTENLINKAHAKQKELRVKNEDLC
jgi:hypothetical protein